jgi:hypothetical protein
MAISSSAHSGAGNRMRSGGGACLGILRIAGQALAGDPPGNPQPDAQRSPDVLWSHLRYDGSSGGRRTVFRRIPGDSHLPANGNGSNVEESCTARRY